MPNSIGSVPYLSIWKGVKRNSHDREMLVKRESVGNFELLTNHKTHTIRQRSIYGIITAKNGNGFLKNGFGIIDDA